MSCTEFTWHSGEFKSQKGNFELFCNPFAVNDDNIPVDMELIELQCTGLLLLSPAKTLCISSIDSD